MLRKTLAAAALIPLAAACSDSTGAEGDGRVSIRFDAQGAGAAVASDVRLSHLAAPGALTLAGSNGTLVLEDIRLIVSEMELERLEGACEAPVAASDDDGDADEKEDCEEFEAGPFLVNLLDGSPDEVVSARIPAGAYTEFEFEVEDLDLDDDDDDEKGQAMQAVFAQMKQAYAGFPSDASMVVHGTFTPTGGAAQPFTVYFDAEIEVEWEFDTAFRVPEDGAITVNLDPAAWFKPGAQVMNLAALDGQTIEFEAEFENGVGEIEHDDD